jgi:hypothetical protein
MTILSMEGKMQISARVIFSPHRYGPENFWRSVSIIFRRSSRSADSLTRLEGD